MSFFIPLYLLLIAFNKWCLYKQSQLFCLFVANTIWFGITKKKYKSVFALFFFKNGYVDCIIVFDYCDTKLWKHFLSG